MLRVTDTLANGGLEMEWIDIPSGRWDSEADRHAVTVAASWRSAEHSVAALRRLHPHVDEGRVRRFVANYRKAVRAGRDSLADELVRDFTHHAWATGGRS